MRTLVLQTISSLLPLAFGLLALAVVRAERGGPPRHARGWRLTALTFIALGTSSTLQASWAVRAYLSGPGTEVYTTYLRWAPAGNVSRYFLMIAFGGALVWLSLERKGEPRLGALHPALLAAALVLGGWIGWWQGPLDSLHRHAALMASLDMVEMLSLIAALLVSLSTAAVERLLWGALAAYTLREPFNVGILSAMAHPPAEGVRVHPSHLLHLVAILVYAVMIAIAARRLVLARQGAEVPAILDVRRTAWRSLAE